MSRALLPNASREACSLETRRSDLDSFHRSYLSLDHEVTERLKSSSTEVAGTVTAGDEEGFEPLPPLATYAGRTAITEGLSLRVGEANPDYWGGPPKVKRITFRQITEVATRRCLGAQPAQLLGGLDATLHPQAHLARSARHVRDRDHRLRGSFVWAPAIRPPCCSQTNWRPSSTSTGTRWGWIGWPGTGRLIVESITYRDYPVIQAGVPVLSLIFVTMDFIVDLLYLYIDPRIKYS